MTIETKNDLPEIEPTKGADGRRHGEHRRWGVKPNPQPQTDDEPLLCTASPPASWPRVFPGL